MRLLRSEGDRGRAVVVVSHDHRLREFADRVLWLEDGRFSDLARLVRDPVCGMEVEADGPHFLEIAGQRWIFCSAGCRREYAEREGAALSSA
jgi:putative ABC transport system ATP-binding protein